MLKVTSITLFNDSVGMRMSTTFSEIDDSGRVVSENKRVDRVITDAAMQKKVQSVMEYAQEFIDSGV